ncbi:MAG: hypothetical protein Q9212_001892 [Teloschistes hypoglaucus]
MTKNRAPTMLLMGPTTSDAPPVNGATDPEPVPEPDPDEPVPDGAGAVAVEATALAEPWTARPVAGPHALRTQLRAAEAIAADFAGLHWHAKSQDDLAGLSWSIYSARWDSGCCGSALLLSLGEGNEPEGGDSVEELHDV